MTTPAPSTVEWIRFSAGPHGWTQMDATKQWAPRLLVNCASQDEDDFIGRLTDGPRMAMPELQVTVDLVVLEHSARSACEAEIRRVHDLLATQREFSIEAAVTMPGLPYNRVSVPRLSADPLSVDPMTTVDGELALRFVEAKLGDRRQYKLTHVS